MRAKSFPVRTWHRSSGNSLDPYPSPSPASLPDEANERVGSGVSTTHRDPQFDSGDADDESVPDTFDESDVPHKKRHCRWTSDTGRGGSDPPNLDACIVCDISDKRVSHCAGIDCLLSFHGECLNAEFGSSDDLASSFCPYCWFKIVALKYKSVREKAVGAEKTVFKYLDKKMNSRDEVKENVPKSQEGTTLYTDENGNQDHSVDKTNIVSSQELQGEKDAYSSREEQVQVEKDSDKSRGDKMSLTEEINHQPEEDLEVYTDKLRDMQEDKVIDEVEASEYEERVDTENFQDAEDDKDGETDKVNRGAGEKGDVSPFLSMRESFSGKEQDPVQQNEKRRGRRRRLILKDIDSEISSNESTNERNGEDGTEQITSSQVVTSPSGKMNEQQKKLSTTTKVAKPNTERGISFFNKDHRKRLYWTSEEEEMLKVGVEKFAAEAKKNMPWRKILEMGEKVFQETRTPSDLKDKWRKMMGKRLEK